MRYHLKEERYIFPLIIILWLCNNSIINYYTLHYVVSAHRTFWSSIGSSSWSSSSTLTIFLPVGGPYSLLWSNFIWWFSQYLSSLFSNWWMVLDVTIVSGKLFHTSTTLFVKLYFLRSLALRCFSNLYVFPLVVDLPQLQNLDVCTLPKFCFIFIQIVKLFTIS